MPDLAFVLTGLGIGVVFGMFGAGGSAFATPALALLGVPGVIAVASPLPSMLPAAILSTGQYLRSGNIDRRVAVLAVAGGLPGTVLGALASSVVDGDRLLVLSGVVLAVLGLRLLLPDRDAAAEAAAARRANTALVLVASLVIGVLTGLLANGGGFLLVPLFILLLGMTTTTASGTSIVAVGALTVPTIASHAVLGHIDWHVALVFGIGVLPGSLAGSWLSQRVPPDRARRVFGVLLVAFAAWFLVRLATGRGPAG